MDTSSTGRVPASTPPHVNAKLAHTILGQCPSLPIHRRLGFRTRQEIDWERYALKALRGDFAGLERDPHDPERLLDAVRR